MVPTRAGLACFFLLLSSSAWAVDRRGRLGVGFSNELDLGVPQFSLKIQKSRSFALGGIVGFNTAEKTGTLGAGLKLYHNIFEEPQLHFYSAFLGAVSKKKIQGGEDSRNDIQCNLTLGSEFSFAGLQSLAFSVEMGLSFLKSEEFTIGTTGGGSFLVASVHFYL